MRLPTSQTLCLWGNGGSEGCEGEGRGYNKQWERTVLDWLRKAIKIDDLKSHDTNTGIITPPPILTKMMGTQRQFLINECTWYVTC